MPEPAGMLGRILQMAVSSGMEAAVLSRLNKGDDVNGRDERGRTPLMIASASGHAHVCRVLLENGADRSASDPEGRTAAVLARLAGHSEVLVLLEPVRGSDTAGDPPAAVTTPGPDTSPDPHEDDGLLWEPEPETAVPDDDQTVRDRAAETQRRLSAHRAADGATDWSGAGEVEQPVLPAPPVIPVPGRVLHPALRARLWHLLDRAMADGCLSAADVGTAIAGRPGQELADEEAFLADRLIQVAGDLGVVIDDGAWAISVPEDEAVGVEDPQEDAQSPVGSALRDIEAATSGAEDVLSRYVADMRRAGTLLTWDQEVELARAMADGIAAAAGVVAAHASALGVLAAACDSALRGMRTPSSLVRSITSEDGGEDESAEDDRDSEDGDGDGAPESAGWRDRVTVLRDAAVGLLDRDDCAGRSKFLSAWEEARVTRDYLQELQGRVKQRPDGDRVSAELARTLAKAESARTRMACANLRLVWSVARKHAWKGMPLPDLLQEGSLGLLKAVDRFDPARGYRFSTYATWWIRQSITRGIADTMRLVRLPVHMEHKLTRLEAARRRLARDGREPPVEALVAASGLTEREVLRLRQLPLEALQPDEVEGGGVPFVDADTAVAVHQRRLELERLLASLTRKEQFVIRMRYGLADGAERTLEEVGAALEVTRERVRQIEAKAMQKLLKARERLAPAPARVTVQPLVDDATTEPPVRNHDVRKSGSARARPDRPDAAGAWPAVDNRPPQAGTVTAAAPEKGPAAAGVPDRGDVSLHEQLHQALELLSSAELQQDFASGVAGVSYQREFARTWFSLYGRVLSEGIDPDTGVLVRSLSGRIREVLERIGFTEIPIERLLADSGWQAVMSMALLAHMQIRRSMAAGSAHA